MADDDNAVPESRSNSLAGLRILLVEDDAFIALDCQQAMIEAGAVSVDLAKSNAAVMRLLLSSTFDVAVIDIHLGDESGIPIAQAVSDRNIAILFCTGTTNSQPLTGPLERATVISKPYNMAELIAAVRAKARP